MLTKSEPVCSKLLELGTRANRAGSRSYDHPQGGYWATSAPLALVLVPASGRRSKGHWLPPVASALTTLEISNDRALVQVAHLGGPINRTPSNC